MKTQYYTATSIDGFIATEDNSLAWLFQFGDSADEADNRYEGFIAEIGAIAMGSTTYEWLTREVPFLEDPTKWMYEQPTWVFSHRELPRVDGPDINFVSGDVRPVHAEMVRAAAGKNVWVVGGGDLVGQFHDHGLLDEVILSVAPVFLGSGAPLLPRSIVTPPLTLVESSTVGGVFLSLRYVVNRATEVGAAAWQETVARAAD